MLLDEPSLGLAPKVIEEIYERINEINRSGVTFVIVEQNARKALRTAHRGYVLDLGLNRLEDTGEGLLKNEEVKRLYLGG
jgi:ABC-type branched-subunit amino acid transport system ATPase component